MIANKYTKEKVLETHDLDWRTAVEGWRLEKVVLGEGEDYWNSPKLREGWVLQETSILVQSSAYKLKTTILGQALCPNYMDGFMS